MGYYYEFHIEVKLRKDTPQQIVDFLRSCIVDKERKETDLPDHSLFKLERWGSLFYRSAYYDISPIFEKGSGGYYFLKLHGEINYGYKEIEAVVNWLSPHIPGHKKKQYIGWYKGESYEVPRINLYVEREIYT